MKNKNHNSDMICSCRKTSERIAGYASKLMHDQDEIVRKVAASALCQAKQKNSGRIAGAQS